MTALARIFDMTDEEILTTLDDHMLWENESGGFTCQEAEAFLAAMTRVGLTPESALWLLTLHAQGDDEGDLHYDLKEVNK